MLRLSAKRSPATLAMLAACAAVFLTALDQTVVVTALPKIIEDLEIQPMQLDHAAWIVSGYLLGYVIVMPLMGRVSDLYGRRRVFLLCLGIFTLGSLLCGLAPLLGRWYRPDFLQMVGLDVSSPGLIWLVLARFIQAAGGGAVVPVAMAVAGDFYGAERDLGAEEAGAVSAPVGKPGMSIGFALGLIGMVTEAGGVLGPVYGSLIVERFGWPMIFYLNVPIVAVLAYFLIRSIPARTGRAEQPYRRRIDFPGALLLGASLICLSTGFSQEAAQVTPDLIRANGGQQNNPWLIGLALILLAAFIALEIVTERRNGGALITLALFKRPMFTATSIMSFLIGAALITAMVNIPLFFLSVFGESDIESGLALLRLTAMIPVGAIIGGWLCGRLTCRWTAVLGLVPTIAGFWLMHLWPVQIDWTLITAGTMLSGLGLGLVIAPISTTAIDAAEAHQLGMASSIVTVLRMIGMILGLAALTSWGLGRFRALVVAGMREQHVSPLSPDYAVLITDAAHTIYTSIFLAAGLLCVLALIPAFFLQSRSTPRRLVRTTSDRSAVPGEIGVKGAKPEYQQPESEASSLHGQREK